MTKKKPRTLLKSNLMRICHIPDQTFQKSHQHLEAIWVMSVTGLGTSPIRVISLLCRKGGAFIPKFGSITHCFLLFIWRWNFSQKDENATFLNPQQTLLSLIWTNLCSGNVLASLGRTYLLLWQWGILLGFAAIKVHFCRSGWVSFHRRKRSQ